VRVRSREWQQYHIHKNLLTALMFWAIKNDFIVFMSYDGARSRYVRLLHPGVLRRNALLSHIVKTIKKTLTNFVIPKLLLL